jgi:hypothetical protein
VARNWRPASRRRRCSTTAHVLALAILLFPALATAQDTPADTAGAAPRVPGLRAPTLAYTLELP